MLKKHGILFYISERSEKEETPEDLKHRRKTERSDSGKRQCPEALKNLNFFEKKLKKGVDKGVRVCYYSQARPSEGAERDRRAGGAERTLKTIQRK